MTKIPSTMQAMVLERPGSSLQLRTLPVPVPEQGQMLVKVSACAVCRTDLHVIDGELPNPKLPLVLGHEIVGQLATAVPGSGFATGMRVGIPWLGWTCGVCEYCRAGRENLCDHARFTGYTLDGGYAQYVSADARFCFPLTEGVDDVSASPLLCAGLIGYRSLIKAGDARRIGIYGFGAAAHIIIQVALHQGREVYAFTRRSDATGQDFARRLGAVWAGASDETPPEKLDAAILFAPAGELVPLALRAVRKGGTVVCGGIHMTDIPSFPYDILWHERSVCSVANLTREDGKQFLSLALTIPVRTQTHAFPLSQADEAIAKLRHGQLEGAAVLDLRLPF